MIILSQDGEKIVNMDNVKEIEIDVFGHADAEKVAINADRKLLGLYNTLMRAKEIILEISATYVKSEMIKNDRIELREGMKTNDFMPAYEMPKK